MTEPLFAIDRVSAFAAALMATVVKAASDLGVPIPTRQVTGTGAIPQDCEQVSIAITQVTTGTPEARSGAAGTGTWPNPGANMTLWTITVQVSIVRGTNDTPKGPLGTIPPTPTAYAANTVNASQDAAVLIEAAGRATSDDLMGSGAGQRSVTFANPAGGMVATNMRFTATV